jgi:glutathione synthase/RimK-type ligase-like ATP-grasp enzyme
MILVLTDDADPHADHVAAKLRQRGAPVVRFDPARFPSRAALSVSYDPTGLAGATLETDAATVDLRALRAVWYRRPRPPVPHDDVTDPPTHAYLAEECKTVMNDVWHALDCPIVPAPPAVIRRAELKMPQLATAGRLGFELPPTLITTCPRAFRAFYRQHGGNIISKLPSSALYRLTGSTFNRYTLVVSTRDVGYAQALRRGPVIFQAYVPKRVELRVTVVGSALFAAEIHSQHTRRTRHDWRRYDHYETPLRPHALPDDVARRCRQLVAELGLCYGAIDLVLTPDGRYVFLEINPNGQYLWIEEATGLPISDALCDLLMAGDGARAVATPVGGSV